MEKHSDALALLRGLWRGKTSRNSDFEAFSKPAARRLHRLYRGLVALYGDLTDPTSRAWLERRGDGATVYVHVDAVRYRRTTRLEGWQADFLLTEMGGERYLDAPSRQKTDHR